jgi:16S rRNA (uracil1498-N3)-methyltransferase
VSARRFFVERTHAIGDEIAIDGSDAHKIVHVLRLRDGDDVEVVDSSGQTFSASIAVDKTNVRVRIDALLAATPQERVAIDLAQAVPKSQKMDFIIEKASELGVRAIFPLVSERTTAREIGQPKHERWQRLARSAAAQCGRSHVARIDPLLGFDDLLKRFPEYGVVLFAWELAPRVALREILPALLDGVRSLLLVIGPEGGFSHDEAARAAAAGARAVWLGRRILRTETAGLAMLSIVEYLL